MQTPKRRPEGEVARILVLAAALATAGCASAPKASGPVQARPGTCSLRELAWTRDGAVASSRVPAEADEAEAAEKGAPVRTVELSKRADRLRVRDSNGKLVCERSDRTTIEHVYAGDAQRVLLVIAASTGRGAAAARTATWVSLDGCKARVPPLSGAAPKVDGAKVIFPPHCEPGHSSQEEMCTSARVFALDADCLPQFLSVESSALTESEIGVAFDGTRTIRRPRTGDAEVIH